ncbi:NAD(P)-dependent oxidoreductase [Alicyclobacillus mengziensis]|uniref:NAD(P)-dependent oxidoreductase n=1 Tax=Alicyclobacillus mengziensis TaxID=2931921 RepID=A0A9X7Z686_9BACL|nr:NAD(P)-dependent oxidoreductase [Alicyclobacillus mengziensis]QSO45963.1 NAD(P)-dependent oxidoreductase [Alicyclobacillus mengziensis]
MTTVEQFAWIGLGTMGAPMVRNASNKGFSITAYNRTKKSVDVGISKTATTVEDAVTGADVVCLMVSDGAAVENVLFGSSAAVKYMKPGSVVVNISTIGVDEAKEFALRLANLGFEWMDAPVSGSVGPASNGTLVFLVGGAEATYRRLEPFFLSMGKTAFHLGPVGSGASMKLLVNAYLGAIVEAASECMAVADKAGLGRTKLLEVLQQTATWAPILAAKTPMWERDDYPQAFALKHMAKDLGLMNQFSRTISASTPVLGSASQVYLAALANDLAEFDMSGVFRETARLAGTPQ